jgi:hypothetical protein
MGDGTQGTGSAAGSSVKMERILDDLLKKNTIFVPLVCCHEENTRSWHFNVNFKIIEL